MKYIATLSFEMTRKCNLKCKWCSKGEPQNLDITTEIIDKTLNEVSDYYINCIRITGGEPFLVPELVVYLIDKIIDKKIKVNMIHIISNATIINEDIRNAIIRFIEYGKTIQEERKNIKEYFSDKLDDVHFERGKNKNIMVALCLSTWEHDNKNTINNVYKFYDSIKSEHFIVVDQNEQYNDVKGTVVIEGLAEKNYKMFSEKELEIIRVIHNKFCIIDDSSIENPCIKKAISVSANGKIYVGCMLSYEHIEKDYLFNILDCNKDFWNKVDMWCWENPIYIRANNFMEIYKAIQWQIEKGYETLLPTNTISGAVDKIKMQIDTYEAILKEYHPQLPHLSHWELNMFAVSVYCLLAFESEATLEQMKPFIAYTTGLNDKLINEMTKDSFQNIYQNAVNINNNRAVETIKNPLMKGICKFLYT